MKRSKDCGNGAVVLLSPVEPVSGDLSMTPLDVDCSDKPLAGVVAIAAGF
jgi:hypothetical protein